MQTVFSHIIQKRFSQENENIATDALAYVLGSSAAALHGMMKLLRGLIPDLPQLRFETQQTEGAIRPDMWGYADTVPRVFVENKFWAGLTDNQPVSYLKQLAANAQPTILLIVVPAPREQALWRELSHRLLHAGITVSPSAPAAGVAFSVATTLGPILALTSWTSVLSALEHETIDDPRARGDLVQLQALCDAADNEAFTPISNVELSDQRTPAFILQVISIGQEVVSHAVRENVLSIAGLRPQASWDRIGRYIWVPDDHVAGAWVGVHLRLWKKHGKPLWLLFSPGEFGRAHDVGRLIEPWAATKGMLTANHDGDFVIALDLPVHEEKSVVISSLVDDLKAVAEVLRVLPPKVLAVAEQG